MSDKSCGCGCCGTNTLVLACSDGSDVSLLAEEAARRLRADINAGLIKTKTARLLLIDGCKKECGKKLALDVNTAGFLHLCLADIGFRKGEAKNTRDAVETVYKKCVALLTEGN